MKRILLAVTVLFSTAAFSQTGIRFGIKAGGNVSFSKTDIQNLSVNGQSDFGFFGGGLMEISPKYAENKFKLQVEALYSNINMKYDMVGDATVNDKLNLQQINIPLLAKYFITPSLSVNAGPTFNFNVGIKETIGDSAAASIETATNDDLNTFQIGLAAGATYYITKGFFVDARYNPLFGQFNKKEDGDGNVKLRLQTIQLGIGYKF